MCGSRAHGPHQGSNQAANPNFISHNVYAYTNTQRKPLTFLHTCVSSDILYMPSPGGTHTNTHTYSRYTKRSSQNVPQKLTQHIHMHTYANTEIYCQR